MRFVMREKLFSLGGDATIKDDQGRDRYFVDGAALALLRKLALKDLEGKELMAIHRVIAIRPTFDIHRDGELVARVSKALINVLVDHFKIDVPGPVDLEARGDIFHHEYGIYRQGQEVAHISKAWISLTDSYGIDIAQGEDEVLLLASAIAIDEIQDIEERDRD